MNDEQFEHAIGHFILEIQEQMRARDTAQREALARLQADHEANGLEYGEALILIGQVLDCRSLEDLNAVRRYLNEFMDRYSLRPVPDVDLVQAEQQEAQGAQAGDDVIKLFERIISQSPADLDKATEDNPWYQVMAREVRTFAAALATQPAILPKPKPIAWRAPSSDGTYHYFKTQEAAEKALECFVSEQEEGDYEDGEESVIPVYAGAAVRGAEHE